MYTTQRVHFLREGQWHRHPRQTPAKHFHGVHPSYKQRWKQWPRASYMQAAGGAHGRTGVIFISYYF